MGPTRVLAAAAVRRVLSPFIPDRKRLPFAYWLHRFRGCGAELAQLDKLFCKRGTAIDVGANAGLFTYVLSKHFRRVYSFEANSDVAMPIRLYNAANVTLYPFGLSSTTRAATFYIPRMGKLELAGWGSLNPGNLPGAERLTEIKVQLRPLDDLEIENVDFIKIDVEGHEIEVLKGATKTIRESRPVVLIEVKQEHLESVTASFQALNFQHWSVEDFFHLQEENSNHIYVPKELISEFGPKWV